MAGPGNGADGTGDSATQAPPDPSAGQAPSGGGADQGPSADPNSPAEISRRLAEQSDSSGGNPPDEVSPAGKAGDGAAPGAAGADGAGTTSDGSGDTTTTVAPDPTPNPDAVSELPSDFDRTPAPPTTAAPDEAPLDAAAPPITQAGHTGHRNSGAALWATAAAFAALLLLSAGWLWTRRRRYDPA